MAPDLRFEGSAMRFFFGDCELVMVRRELRRRGTTVAISRLPFDVLVHLVVNRSRLVTKDELATTVWQRPVVSDDAITRAVSEVRRAIGDDGRAQSLISTARGIGYTFVGSVNAVPTESPAAFEPAGGDDRPCGCTAVERLRRAADTLARQLDGLPVEKRRALRLIAALGRTFDEEALRRLELDARRELTGGGLLEVFAEALRWGLIRPADGTGDYEFAHEAVRRLVLDGAPGFR